VLARRYRVLLRCYPAAYRRRWGDEVLGVLLDESRPGQRWPAVRVAADLVRCGLRRWLREDAVPGLGPGLRAAAPVALALAVGLSAFLLVSGGLSAPGGTLAPVAYGCWLAAGVGAVTLPATARYDLLAAATAATVLVVPAAAVLGTGRPPLWAVAVLGLYGVIALAGHATAAPAATRRRALAAAATVGAVPSLVLQLLVPAGGRVSAYYGAGLMLAGATTAAVLAAVAARAVRAGRPYRWAWLLLAQPAAWLVLVRTTWSGWPAPPWPPVGRLAQFLVAATVAAGAIVWFAHRRSGRPDPGPRGTIGASAAGTAATLAAYLLVAGTLPQHWPPLALLLAVTALDPPLRAWWRVPTATATAALATTTVAGYAANWHPTGWHSWFDASPLVTALTLVPLLAGAMRALAAATTPHPPIPPTALAAVAGRRVVVRSVALAGCCVAGAGYLLLPSVPLVTAGLVVVAGATVAAVAGRSRRRDPARSPRPSRWFWVVR
jgi:hypothetical protein